MSEPFFLAATSCIKWFFWKMFQIKLSAVSIKHSVTVSAVIAGIALTTLLIGIPTMLNEVANMEKELLLHRREYIDLTNLMWHDLMNEKTQIRHIRTVYIDHEKRQYNGGSVNARHPRSSCQTGPQGPPGIPGEAGKPICLILKLALGMDGMDGQPGGPGMGGEELQSIAMFSEDNNPYSSSITKDQCNLCPAGRPGLRGYKGKRGLRGPMGEKGPPGRPGNPGELGDEGPEGEPGLQGDLGPSGPRGPPGEEGIGYTKGSIGPKGPIGMVGMEGDEGPPGERGDDAPLGPVGDAGIVGLPGSPGKQGMPGANGQPGPPGTDAEYCPCPYRSKEPLSQHRSTSGTDSVGGDHPFETNSIFSPSASPPTLIPSDNSEAVVSTSLSSGTSTAVYEGAQPAPSDTNPYESAPPQLHIEPETLNNIYPVAIPAPKTEYYPNSTPQRDPFGGGGSSHALGNEGSIDYSNGPVTYADYNPNSSVTVGNNQPVQGNEIPVSSIDYSTDPAPVAPVNYNNHDPVTIGNNQPVLENEVPVSNIDSITGPAPVTYMDYSQHGYMHPVLVTSDFRHYPLLASNPPAIAPGADFHTSHEKHQESGYQRAEHRSAYRYGSYPPTMKRAFKFRRNRKHM